jgi:hypothetical protein
MEKTWKLDADQRGRAQILFFVRVDSIAIGENGIQGRLP